MKFKLTFTAIILSSFFIASFAQSDLYKPKEIKKAYKKETRSISGQPGKNYWQNYVVYKIDVQIKPENKLVVGSETIEYTNNSPDSLKSIVVKLNQNMNKKGAVRFLEIGEDAVTEGMNVTKIFYNQSELSQEPSAKQTNLSGTNLVLRLPTPLPPKQKAELKLEWNFTIPASSNPRMGWYDSTSFFLGYWYPKIAVYDDINGWDTYSYEGAHEFYQEYSDFDVNITVPHGCFVWATGMVKNYKELFNKQFSDKYEEALISDSVVHIVTVKDLEAGRIFPQKSALINWRYEAKNVPDFAFGISDHYLWDAASLEVEPGRRTVVQAAYNPDSKFFADAVKIARRSVDFFSNIMPGFPYTYPSITVYNGSEGMEYPMIVNDGDFGNAIADIYVTSHEIAHMYFPFIVGVNETRYAWMDEGFAYFLPFDVQYELSNFDHRIRAARGVGIYSGSETDYPMMIPSFASVDPDLSMLSYYKPALSYLALQNALGEEMFSKSLKEFINRWEGKHPLPYDFFYTFEDVTGENLSWFWKPWYFERAVPDVAIKEANVNGDELAVIITNIGGMPVPVELKFITDDGTEIKESLSSSIWKDKKGITVKKVVEGKVIKVELGSPIIPDSDLTNNSYTIK